MTEPQKELIVVLVGLIRERMKLKQEQVLVYNQNWKMPPDAGLHVVVSAQPGEKVYGSTLAYEDAGTGPNGENLGLTEVQRVNVQESYSVDIMSFDGQARQRKQEIVFALNSTTAQQLAERYAFKIGNIPNHFVDVSAAEGPAMLNRYRATFNVLRGYTSTAEAPYFDKFGKSELLLNP
jgi:hypothetical protein